MKVKKTKQQTPDFIGKGQNRMKRNYEIKKTKSEGDDFTNINIKSDSGLNIDISIFEDGFVLIDTNDRRRYTGKKINTEIFPDNVSSLNTWFSPKAGLRASIHTRELNCSDIKKQTKRLNKRTKMLDILSKNGKDLVTIFAK